MSMNRNANHDGDVPVLLVGVSNPATTPELMALAARMARHRGYQVVAIHIVTVPDQMGLGDARNSPQVAAATHLLRQAIREAAAHGVTARGVVEVAREVHEGLISAAASQRAELLLVGYEEKAPGTARGEHYFDKLVEKVARGTAVDLIAAKFRKPHIASILMPVLGGVNLPVSGMLLRSILRDSPAAVTFIRAVAPDADAEAELADLRAVLAAYELDELGEPEIVAAAEPQAAIIERANQFDLAIIGAERPTLVEVLFGNMAERIVSQATCSTFLVLAARQG